MIDVDIYLKKLNSAQRNELERIRKITKDIIPDVGEKISYGIPTMTYKNKNLLHFAAFKDHMSLFPTSGPTQELVEKLAAWDTSKGTIQFTSENPLPKKIIIEIIKLRIQAINHASSSATGD